MLLFSLVVLWQPCAVHSGAAEAAGRGGSAARDDYRPGSGRRRDGVSSQATKKSMVAICFLRLIACDSSAIVKEMAANASVKAAVGALGSHVTAQAIRR